SARYTTFYGVSPELGTSGGFYDVTPSTILDITGLSQIQVFGLSVGAASMVRIQIYTSADYCGLMQARAHDGAILTVELRKSPYRNYLANEFDPMPPEQVRNVVATLSKPWASFTFDSVLGAGFGGAGFDFHADSRLWASF